MSNARVAFEKFSEIACFKLFPAGGIEPKLLGQEQFNMKGWQRWVRQPRGFKKWWTKIGL